MRLVRAEMTRHYVDTGLVQMSVSNNVVYLYGKVKPMRGYEHTFEESVDGMIKGIRQIGGIRDVVTQFQSF
jgi:osmotically-inducible protein OsmY